MSPSQPLVSIITPYYNAGAYIDDTLGSFAHQSYKNIEVILVNDGSTAADTAVLQQVVKKYQHQFPITVIEQENQGVVSARNVGVAAAKGEYLTFVDNDDMLCGRHSLLSRVTFLQKNPEFAGVAGYGVKMDTHKEILETARHPQSQALFIAATENPDQLLRYYCQNIVENTTHTVNTLFFLAGSSLLRASAARSIPFEKEFETEDDIVWLIRFLQKNKLSLQLTPYHFRRVHEQQYSLATPGIITQAVINLAKEFC